MHNSYVYALAFAGLAAVGNALFAFGQKRAEITDNPFIFLIAALIVCIILLVLSSIMFLPKTQMVQYIGSNYWLVVISGVGFYLTFLGFYYLYTRYGASYYSLYAVLSILTTSILLGALIFKEEFNVYHALSIVCALLTIAFLALGYSKSAH